MTMTLRDARAALDRARDAIVTCERCPRLRTYCQQVARDKKAAYRHETYWAKPVPGFGDVRARILILGLAPAAHGANRTGRVFTGDGIGASGDFLMSALHRAAYANITTSQRTDDGLRLRDVYIAAAIRCAPPANKPLPEEIVACADHLASEVALLPRLRVVVALGKIAWDAWLAHLSRGGLAIRPRPPFAHGAVVDVASVTSTMGNVTADRRSVPRVLVGAFHPSRQNTNTGKLTGAMYDEVFAHVRGLLETPAVMWPGRVSTQSL